MLHVRPKAVHNPVLQISIIVDTYIRAYIVTQMLLTNIVGVFQFFWSLIWHEYPMDRISGFSMIATVHHHIHHIAQKLLNGHMYYNVYYTYNIQKIP